MPKIDGKCSNFDVFLARYYINAWALISINFFLICLKDGNGCDAFIWKDRALIWKRERFLLSISSSSSSMFEMQDSSLGSRASFDQRWFDPFRFSCFRICKASFLRFFCRLKDLLQASSSSFLIKLRSYLILCFDQIQIKLFFQSGLSDIFINHARLILIRLQIKLFLLKSVLISLQRSPFMLLLHMLCLHLALHHHSCFQILEAWSPLSLRIITTCYGNFNFFPFFAQTIWKALLMGHMPVPLNSCLIQKENLLKTLIISSLSGFNMIKMSYARSMQPFPPVFLLML